MNPRQPTSQMRTGFTAIEMMVVTALMLLLLTLVLPSLQKAPRDHADALRCQARLHQIGKYMGMYTDRNNGAFPKWFYETQGGEEPWETEAFTIQTAARTLADAGLVDVPLSLFVCPADRDPSFASVLQEEGDPITMPLSYSYNVGSTLWGLQYWKMMEITPYERWPIMFDGQYGPQIAGGYLSPSDFAHQTIVSRHPIDVGYVLYADWHVEPLLAFRYRHAPRDTQVVVADPVEPPPPGGEDPPVEEEEEVPPPPDHTCDFDIEDGEVCVNEDFIASVVVIGTSITYSGQYDIPVTTSITAGGDVYQPFGPYNDALAGAVSAGSTWEYQGEAGDKISIEGMSWVKKTVDVYEDVYNKKKRKWEKKKVGTTTVWEPFLDAVSTGGNRVELLRNGSDVPDVKGFMGQTGVGDMVADYVENDKIKLDDNQVIALFELGATNPNSDAFDLQDLVVLITLDPRTAQ